MIRRSILEALVLVIAVSMIVLTPTSPNYPTAKAAATPTLRVVSPTYGSNITDLSLSTGTTFAVNVVVANAGMLTGFDIALNYGMNQYLTNPIIETSVTLSPGLFDGSNIPSPCAPYTLRQDTLPGPLYVVRIAEVVIGGCQVVGDGTLCSVTFQVTGTGATSLDINQASAGQKPQLLVGGIPNGPVPGLQVSGAYFRNKAGVPPVATFTYTPPAPAVGISVTFNATQSYDPYNQVGSSKGITKFIWDFSDASPEIIGTPAQASIVNHVFLITQTVLGSGYFSVKLVVVDGDDALPSSQTLVVFIDPGKTHDVAISVSSDKTTVHVGETVLVTVIAADRGNQNENVGLNVTYDYQGKTVLDPDNGGQDKNFSMTVASPSVNFRYTVQTASLTPRVYTVSPVARLLGTNVTDANPANNADQVSFTLLPATTTNNSFSLSIPALAIGAVVVLAAGVGGVQLLRRQRRIKEASED